MLDNNTIEKIIVGIEALLNTSIVHTDFPHFQGTDGDIFIVTDKNANEYAIKYSSLAINDVVAIKMIRETKLNIPVPKMFGYFFLKVRQSLY